MLRQLYNIGGLCMLYFIATQFPSWTLLVNHDNIFSPYFVSYINAFSFRSIQLILFFIGFALFLSIITRRFLTLSAIISVLLMHVCIKTSLSIFTLEEITNFAFFKLHHPIPLDAKIYYMKVEASNIFASLYPNLNFSKEKLELLKIKLDLTGFDVNDLKYKNLNQIREFANQYITNIHRPIDDLGKKAYASSVNIDLLIKTVGLVYLLTYFPIPFNLIINPSTFLIGSLIIKPLNYLSAFALSVTPYKVTFLTDESIWSISSSLTNISLLCVTYIYNDFLTDTFWYPYNKLKTWWIS